MLKLYYFVVKNAAGKHYLIGSDSEYNWYIEGELRNQISETKQNTFEIITEYGTDCCNSGEMWDKFLRSFKPEPSKISDSSLHVLGWLSPEGNFYQCENGGHQELAYELLTAFYTADDDDWQHYCDCSNELHDRGWIDVNYGGALTKLKRGDLYYKITKQQKDIIEKLISYNINDTKYTMGLKEFLKDSKVTRSKNV